MSGRTARETMKLVLNGLFINNETTKQRHNDTTWGFTVVELIVALAITGILMLGLSTFFSSTFHNLFQAQSQTEGMERQFVVNEIIRDKFTDLKDLVKDSDNHVLIQNEITKNQLPFSYIGTTDIDDEGHLAFKDIMIFNKIIDPGSGSHLFGDSGSGQILKAVDGGFVKTVPKNFAGFTKIGNKYYIVFPDGNTVKECDAGCTNLDFSSIGNLSHPTDISTDGTNLYISDSGNNRIIKYSTFPQVITPAPTNLNFPTGLSYYEKDASNKFLFVSDTFNHKIKRINLSTFDIETVVGEGEISDCQNSAKFCKLNFPTGLFADKDNHELYIADSGNNQILKMSDPDEPADLHFTLTPGDNYALNKIEFINDTWSGGSYNEAESNLIGNASHYDSGTKTFRNPERLTTYSNSPCVSTTGFFYVNEDISGMGLGNQDKLKINDSIYTVTGWGTQDCDLDPAVTLTKYRIKTQEAASGVGDSEIVYFANPDTVEVQINGPITIGDGYQTIEIKTYDVFRGLVFTDYHPERVGDGVLGTSEDIIEVYVDDLNFPTGVTNAYYANSGEGNVRKMDGSNPKTLNPIDTSIFDVFDYISDFVVESITFNKYNSDSVLELVINAKIDEEKTQTYKINAVIP